MIEWMPPSIIGDLVLRPPHSWTEILEGDGSIELRFREGTILVEREPLGDDLIEVFAKRLAVLQRDPFGERVRAEGCSVAGEPALSTDHVFFTHRGMPMRRQRTVAFGYADTLYVVSTTATNGRKFDEAAETLNECLAAASWTKIK